MDTVRGAKLITCAKEVLQCTNFQFKVKTLESIANILLDTYYKCKYSIE